MKKNKIISILFYIILSILLVYLGYLIYTAIKIDNLKTDININTISINKEEMKRKRKEDEINTQLSQLGNFKITEDFIKELDNMLLLSFVKTKKRKSNNMLDLYKTSNIGYPNFGKNAYVLCYMNSALQFIRTLLGSTTDEQDKEYDIKKLDKTIKNILNYTKPRTKELVNHILKYLVLNHKTRIESFYNIDNLIKEKDIDYNSPEKTLEIRQSDSYEFLSYLLQKIEINSPKFINSIKFEETTYIVDTDNSSLIYNSTNSNSSILLIEPQYLIDNTKNKSLKLSSLIQNNITYFSTINNYRINGELKDVMQLKYYHNFSEYIIVILNIFQPNYTTGRHTKLNINLDIDSTDVSFLSGTNEIDLQENNYYLISMICHQGDTPNSGHYVNFSKRLEEEGGSIYNGKWWYYNDDIVEQIGTVSKLNKKIKKEKYIPYALLFKKRNIDEEYFTF